MKNIELGQVVATAGIDSWAKDNPETRIVGIARSLQRHAAGDWGDVCDEDKKLNDDAAASGEARLLSAYTVDGEKVWVITEWDRSVTTVLFPSEY
jgi:hypothetical protein